MKISIREGGGLRRIIGYAGAARGGEDWNSVLVYKYPRGTELKNHIDRDVFDPKVVIINFCKGLVGFNYGSSVVWLKNGEVIEINNRIKHGVLKVNEERWSVSFRKVL